MPDPQVLLIVAAVVVLGLIAWVVIVLVKAKPQADAAPLRREAMAGAGAGGAASASEPPPAKSSGSDEAAKKPSLRATPAASTSEPPPSLSNLPSVQSEVTIDVEEDEEPTGPHALILVTAVGRTDPGLKRKHNEDAYTILENHHLFVIADGMGRHAAGEVASQLCVDAIRDCFNDSKFPKISDGQHLPRRANRIKAAIGRANDVILKTSQENDAYAGMGTTVVAAYFSPNNQRVYIAHVGDSRCYRFRDGKLIQLTTDHTLGAAGIVGKSAAVLSRAVGVEENVEVDVTMESPLPGDIYLLCSDGLSRMVNDAEITETVSVEKDLDVATKKLIDTANARGGRDNITTILVRVDSAKRLSEKPEVAAKA